MPPLNANIKFHSNKWLPDFYPQELPDGTPHPKAGQIVMVAIGRFDFLISENNFNSLRNEAVEMSDYSKFLGASPNTPLQGQS